MLTMLKEYSERCLQHEAIIKKQKFNEIKFIYAVHKYDSMLECLESSELLKIEAIIIP